jgi:hypothetical protein
VKGIIPTTVFVYSSYALNNHLRSRVSIIFIFFSLVFNYFEARKGRQALEKNSVMQKLLNNVTAAFTFILAVVPNLLDLFTYMTLLLSDVVIV